MWKVGQKLICIKKGNWIGTITGTIYIFRAPKHNEIVELDGYKSFDLIYLKGYNEVNSIGVRVSFKSDKFKPLLYSDNAISEILSNFAPLERETDFEPVKELTNFSS